MHDAHVELGRDPGPEGELAAEAAPFAGLPGEYQDAYTYASSCSSMEHPHFLGLSDLQLDPALISHVDASPCWDLCMTEYPFHNPGLFCGPESATHMTKTAAYESLSNNVSPVRTDEHEDDTHLVTSKRKAQNRSAQRNLRQRKMRHVRDLEDGINLLQDKQSLLHTNNELLKLQLDNLKVENQVLHATIRPAPSMVDSPLPVMGSRVFQTSLSDRSSTSPTTAPAKMIAPSCCSSPESETTLTAATPQDARIPIPRRAHKKSKTGCRTCKQRKVKCDERRPLCLNCERHFTNLKTCDFDEQEAVLQAAAVVPQRASRRPSAVRSVAPRPKKTLMAKYMLEPEPSTTTPTEGLTINAAWQVLQNHPQYLLDRVDVTGFCEGLRKLAAFDGKALVFEKERVLALIDEASRDPSRS